MLLGKIYGDWRRPLIAAASITLLGFLILTEKQPVKVAKPLTEKIVENRSVWIEYNGFWGNPAVDGRWMHWNYRHHKYATAQDPPAKVPCKLFPQLGLYSSHDVSVIRRHFHDLSMIGVDAVLLQWYPPNRVAGQDDDDTANFTEKTLEMMLDVAGEFHLEVGVQIQNYHNRNNETVFEDIEYFMKNYGSHKQILRVGGAPVVVIYDSHELKGMFRVIEKLSESWGRIYFVTNAYDRAHIVALLEEGYSAVFSYFASDGVTLCSNTTHWRSLVKFARERQMSFWPTVGPGFDASLSDPWASKEKRSRESGSYYKRLWKSAVDAKPAIIVINSFNDFRQATNIENAIDRKGFEFSDATWSGSDGEPGDFMTITHDWINYFKGFAPQPSE